MCESAKDIQRQWTFKMEDYIFDPADGEARVWFGYPSKEYSEFIWLPRQDQLQELCIDSYVRIMDVSEYDCFVRLLESYSSWLTGIHNIIWNIGGGYKDVDTFEELMISFAMEIMYDKKWDGENWVKAHKACFRQVDIRN